MPKSKRSRPVALTKTAKKTKSQKSSFIQEVRDAIDSHKTLYLFSFENMRSHKFKDIRMHFSDSRIFLGKNKLVQIALGRTPEEEYEDNLRHVAKLVSGSVGLLLTSRDAAEVEAYFASCVQSDFARAGATAPRAVVVTREMVETHPVSMVEQFRKLGLPVEIKNGRVTLIGDMQEHVLCKEGQVLSAEACKALVHFGVQLAEFKVELLCRWRGGEFDMLS